MSNVITRIRQLNADKGGIAALEYALLAAFVALAIVVGARAALERASAATSPPSAAMSPKWTPPRSPATSLECDQRLGSDPGPLR
jgi:Flp pilus assembly pilin Flp